MKSVYIGFISSFNNLLQVKNLGAFCLLQTVGFFFFNYSQKLASFRWILVFVQLKQKISYNSVVGSKIML